MWSFLQIRKGYLPPAPLVTILIYGTPSRVLFREATPWAQIRGPGGQTSLSGNSVMDSEENIVSNLKLWEAEAVKAVKEFEGQTTCSGTNRDGPGGEAHL